MAYHLLKTFILIWLLMGEVKSLPPPKPESTLREGYGLLYQFLGSMYHGVNRFWILLGYNLPQMYYRTTQDMLPTEFCSDLEDSEVENSMLAFVCNRLWPMALRNQEKIKVLQEQLDHIAYQDIPAILPGFQPEDIEYSLHTNVFEGETDSGNSPFGGYKEERELNETYVELMEREHEERYEEDPELDNMLAEILERYENAPSLTNTPFRGRRRGRDTVLTNMKDKTQLPITRISGSKRKVKLSNTQPPKITTTQISTTTIKQKSINQFKTFPSDRPLRNKIMAFLADHKDEFLDEYWQNNPTQSMPKTKSLDTRSKQTCDTCRKLQLGRKKRSIFDWKNIKAELLNSTKLSSNDECICNQTNDEEISTLEPTVSPVTMNVTVQNNMTDRLFLDETFLKENSTNKFSDNLLVVQEDSLILETLKDFSKSNRTKRNVEPLIEEISIEEEIDDIDYAIDWSKDIFTLTDVDTFIEYLSEKQFREEDIIHLESKVYENNSNKTIVRKKRFLSLGLQAAGLIMDGVKMGHDIKAQKKMAKSIKILKKRMGKLDGKIIHLRKDMVSIAQATFADIDRIMKMLKHVHKELNYMYWQINKLKIWMLEHEEKIMDLATALALMTEIWSRVLDWQNREITLLLNLITEMNHLLDALDNLSTGLLSHTVISPYTMANMIRHVKETLIMNYPEFELVIEETHDYYNVPIGSFSYSEGMLAIQVPLFIKPKLQIPLILYQLKSVPVPYHMNEEMVDPEESRFVYTWLKPSSSMLAMNKDTYIGVEDEDLKKCIYLGQTYICQDVFLMKHRNFHTCESAIYYRQDYDLIKELCNIDYYPHLEPEPNLLDQGDQLLLTGLTDTWTYYCHAENQLPNPIGTGHYVIVNKTDLCRCSISSGEYHIQQNIAYCTDDTDAELQFGYTVNMAVIMYLYEEQSKALSISDITLYNSPYNYDPQEPEIWDNDEDDVYHKEFDEEYYALDEVMKNLLAGKISYTSNGDKYVGNDEVSEWWTSPKEGSGFKRFLFITGIMTLVIIVVIVILVMAYVAIKGRVKILDQGMTRILAGVGITSTQIKETQARCDTFQVLTDHSVGAYVDSHGMHCIVKCVYTGIAWKDYLKVTGSLLVLLILVYIVWKVLKCIFNYLFGNGIQNYKFWKFYNYANNNKLELYLVCTKKYSTGQSTKLPFYLGTFEGTMEDLSVEGVFRKGDVIYKNKLPWGYFCISWSSLNLKHKAVPLTLPTFLQVSFNKTWKMNLFTKSLGKDRDLVEVQLFTKSIWNQEWNRVTRAIPLQLDTNNKIPIPLEPSVPENPDECTGICDIQKDLYPMKDLETMKATVQKTNDA